MIYFDTETCGLHGMAVLIQWAEDDGPIHLHSPWTVPIRETLELIERFANHPGGVCGFNLTFDWFHLCKLYTVFSMWHDREELPENIVNELAELEMAARDGPCLKPVTAMDLMLHARKGPYQSTMDRGDIRIKRVPTAIAWQLADELERRIPLKDIYFARKKDKRAPKWNVYDIEDEDGVMNPDFKDIVLKFAPSSALKALAVDTGIAKPEDVLTFGDVEVDSAWYPEEHGYAPFARAMGGNRHDWKGAWPEKIRHHISHWTYNNLARRYAEDDVKYTRGLYQHFGCPASGDDDSVLACMVGAVRWRGYKLDMAKLRELRASALKMIGETPTAPGPVRFYVTEFLDPTERLVLKGSTKKVLLEEIAKWKRPCPHCNGEGEVELVEEQVDPYIVEEFDAPATIMHTVITGVGKKDCPHCSGDGKIPHPASTRAQAVLDARKAIKQIEIYDKLLLAGRFHASFKVIGTLSSRMSGTDGLNAQGINSSKAVRECFPLAWDGFILCGGDFAGFEVTLAEACYNDPELRKDLLTCERCEGSMEFVLGPTTAEEHLGGRIGEYVGWRLKAEAKEAASAKDKGKTYVPKCEAEVRKDRYYTDFVCTQCGSRDGKKIHALFGVHVFPDMDYAAIKKDKEKYTRCKQAVFAMFYGGEGPTLQDRLGVDLETANKAFEKFARKYKRVGVARQRIYDMFCSMRQPNGIGTKVEWHEPAEYIESMFGFRRYFSLENRICFTLFQLANDPPRSWREVKVRVMRRDREQSAGGAAQSALYAAAFALQASNMRAGANHEIQSSGAQVTKKTERRIWDIQPSGVCEWYVIPMNIHDEIMCPTRPDKAEVVHAAVGEVVESFRPKVPLIKMDWVTGLGTWADKG